MPGCVADRVSLAASCCVGTGLGGWGRIGKSGEWRTGVVSRPDEFDNSPDLIINGDPPLVPELSAEECGATGKRFEGSAKAAGVDTEIACERESTGVLGVAT